MDGNVMLSTELDTRPVTQSLSNLKKKIVEVFKGADVKTLQTGLKEVTAEIKATEAQARKAQAALDALMSGEKTPQSVKNLERDLKAAQKESDTLDAKWRKLKATSAELQSAISGGTLTPAKERAAVDKLAQVRDELRAVQQEANDADAKVVLLQKALKLLKQNPELTPEAQRYQQTLDETAKKLPELQARYAQLGNEAQRVGLATRLQQTSIVSGFQHIERRIIGLMKRVFFFTLITKALRAVRSQVSALIASDSQLSTSLAQVKGNLATAFGTIWVSVLPAIRALINFLAKATAYLAAFISWLTGKSFKAGQQAMQSISDASGTTAGNTGKIGKAAKKAAKELNRMLLPFDQMNVLSKDTADGGGGAGGGGGGGAGGLGGPTWPKEMDSVMAKFEKFKDLILLIGAAFAAWKLSKIASALLGISRIKAFVGLTALIAGIALLVTSIRDLIKNGPSVENICGIIAGGLLAVGGAIILLTGATGLGLVIAGIGLLVLGFRNLYKNFAPLRKYVDKALKSIKKAFGKGKLSGFKEIGKQIMLGVLNGIKWVIKKIGSWIKKNVVEPIKKWFKKRFGIASPAKEMLEIGKDIMLGVLEGILEPIKKIGDWVKEHVLNPIKEALFGDGEDGEEGGFFINIGAKFEDTKDSIKEKWDAITSGIEEKVATIWSEVKEKVKGAIEELKEKWETIKDKTATLLGEAKEKVAGAISTLKAGWESVTDKVATLWADAKERVVGALGVLKTAWDGIGTKTETLWAEAKEKVAGAIDKIKEAWGLASNVTKTLTANKTGSLQETIVSALQAAWKLGKKKTVKLKASISGTAMSTWTKLKNAWEAIQGTHKATLMARLKAVASDAWNAAATKLNQARAAHPTLLGWLPQLPTLAKGAVIPANNEFLAVLGDQKRGTNIETPLQTMVDAFNAALQQSGYNGAPQINVYLEGDAKQIFRVVRTEASNYTRSTGKAAFNL